MMAVYSSAKLLALPCLAQPSRARPRLALNIIRQDDYDSCLRLTANYLALPSLAKPCLASPSLA